MYEDGHDEEGDYIYTDVGENEKNETKQLESMYNHLDFLTFYQPIFFKLDNLIFKSLNQLH